MVGGSLNVIWVLWYYLARSSLQKTYDLWWCKKVSIIYLVTNSVMIFSPDLGNHSPPFTEWFLATPKHTQIVDFICHLGFLLLHLTRNIFVRKCKHVMVRTCTLFLADMIMIFIEKSWNRTFNSNYTWGSRDGHIYIYIDMYPGVPLLARPIYRVLFWDRKTTFIKRY